MGDLEFVPHTADIALRARGRDLPDLLRTAALGVTAAATDQERIIPRRAPDVGPRTLRSEGAPDQEGLLVSFLNEVIFQGEVNGELYTDFEVLSVSLDGGVCAAAYPDPGLAPAHAVKAATYYGLHVARTARGLEATIVFDV